VNIPAGSGRRDRAPGGNGLAVNKVTWQKVGRVTEPGRYMFTFGWLTIAAQDLAVWRQFPNAAFTLVQTATTTTTEAAEEFHLGAFEPGEDLSQNEK
jgi:hypothetical protein